MTYLAWAVLIALASYRAWRLIAMDQITEPLRAPLVASDSRVAVWALDLIGCPWCLGWWLAGVATALATAHNDWGLIESALVWLAASTLTGWIANLLGD